MKNDILGKIMSAIRSDDGRAQGVWNGIVLQSFFQPVFGVAQRRIIGFEALARGLGPDGRLLFPRDIFPFARTSEEIVFLDRLLRTLHILNFKDFSETPLWLFLNVDPIAATRGREFGEFFEDLLTFTNVNPQRLVIEILESAIEQETSLTDAAEYYRNCGTLIAIDDFGAGHSNFDRIWSMRPEIVKLDRNTILHAAKRPEVQRLLPELIALIRASGSLCLIEGIETPEECRIALGTETDFVQGFHFARPEKILDLSSSIQFDRIVGSMRARNLVQEDLERFNSIIENFRSLVQASQNQRAKEVLPGIFSSFPCVVRYFVLDELGRQFGENEERTDSEKQDGRFQPLKETKRALWSHRGYFRHAISNPGNLHLSPPYLSTTGVHMCRTLSIAIKSEKGLFVHCLDIDWMDPSEFHGS